MIGGPLNALRAANLQTSVGGRLLIVMASTSATTAGSQGRLSLGDASLPSYHAATVPSSIDPPDQAEHDRLHQARSRSHMHAKDLVQIGSADIQAFLRILRAIHRLREQVTSTQRPDLALFSMTERWSIFVHLLVCRFMLWQEKCLVRGRPLANELPPLDVLLVWITYLASPRT